MTQKSKKQLIHIGWREWVSLPELGIPAIKAKIDTGARTSALHAFSLESFRQGGRLRVRFGLHPLQKKKQPELFCTADVVDQRVVSDSGGHREERFVIETPVQIKGHTWPIEITLTNREDMLFRMLLGRTAMRGRIHVDPGKSFLAGKELEHFYSKNQEGRL